MSGRYSIHTGSEHILVGPFEPSCLPVSLPIMPTPFKALPDTHDRQVAPRQRERVVNESWCPWGRGFDSYVGYLGGNESYKLYYNHSVEEGLRMLSIVNSSSKIAKLGEVLALAIALRSTHCLETLTACALSDPLPVSGVCIVFRLPGSER